MRKMVNRYKISKFKCFMNGLTFALISLTAVALCFYELSVYSDGESQALLTFFIAMISMLLGLFTMFRKKNIHKEKVH